MTPVKAKRPVDRTLPGMAQVVTSGLECNSVKVETIVLSKLHRVLKKVRRAERHVTVNCVVKAFAADTLDVLPAEPIGVAPPQKRALDHQFAIQRYSHATLARAAPDPLSHRRIGPVAPLDDRLTLIHQGFD